MSALKRPNNQGLTQNSSELLEILNRHFTSVGKNLADDVPSSSRHVSEYFSDQVYPNSFFFNADTSSEIESEILSTPLNKAYGLYSCPIRISKGAKHILSDIIATIINLSRLCPRAITFPHLYK